MKLKEFIESFVCKNTLIRLWYEQKESSGYIMVGNELAMEHELLKEKGRLSNFSENKIVGVKDILMTDGRYVEAVNIVIERK